MSLDPMTAPLSYLATPYSDYPQGQLVAFVRAAKLAAKLLYSGVNVYSPIAHMHPMAVYGRLNLLDRALWREFDKAMLAKADVLIVAHLEGWRESEGIAHEVDVFTEAGKPIYDLDPVTLTMTRRADVQSAIAAAHGKIPNENAGAP